MADTGMNTDTQNGNPGALRSRPLARELAVFGGVSVLLLVSLAIAPAKDYFSQWRHHQKAYLKLASGRQSGPLVRNFHSGIRQIWVEKLGVVDRCETCHLNMNGALVDATAQPSRRHPVMPHPLDQFGCVMCHRGQGVATTAEEAHSATAAWEQPLLPARYSDAGCGQCHLGPLPGAPKVNDGRRLLSSQGCTHCHLVRQPDGTVVKPDDNPPPLTHIAEKTSRDWIFAWIKNPQAYAASATMPNFQFNDQDAADIATFLISQSTPSTKRQEILHTPPATVPSAATDSASLYGSLFCSSCHAAQNAAGNLVGGNFGPELTRIGNKVTPQWLGRWLRNPHDYEPSTRMPHYRLDDKQVALLSSYLLGKTDSDFAVTLHAPPGEKDSVTHGRKLVLEYGCAACHQINGVNPPQNFGPDLSLAGNKPLSQVVFAPGVAENLPAYISAKVHDPRSFGTGLKMPKFSLTDTQIESLTTALLAQTDRADHLPGDLLIPAPRPTNYQPGGEAGRLMEDLHCLSCHTIHGHGGDMAPDLSFEGSAVQRAWLEDFMKNPNTLRPALIRRMPKFNLSSAEIKTLSDYLLSAYQAPGFDAQALDTRALNTEAAARGRQLFYSKYNCQSCHIVDYKTDKGYVGPALAGAGLRLTPVWTYKWLKDPNSLRPGTVMPNQNLRDDEARDLTAFLMTLKARTTGGGK
ncbi:MAG TPA: c-type cytochrome [Candidatus Saccharimonadales bacterium]|jgi:mono/diheme cytochrome c family protein|nr:c-type cytochrome [Candidatus Saccharimonadales bacterium]